MHSDSMLWLCFTGHCRLSALFFPAAVVEGGVGCSSLWATMGKAARLREKSQLLLSSCFFAEIRRLRFESQDIREAAAKSDALLCCSTALLLLWRNLTRSPFQASAKLSSSFFSSRNPCTCS